MQVMTSDDKKYLTALALGLITELTHARVQTLHACMRAMPF